MFFRFPSRNTCFTSFIMDENFSNFYDSLSYTLLVHTNAKLETKHVHLNGMYTSKNNNEQKSSMWHEMKRVKDGRKTEDEKQMHNIVKQKQKQIVKYFTSP